jgi:ABC-type multidrug transport system ATPase subunit
MINTNHKKKKKRRQSSMDFRLVKIIIILHSIELLHRIITRLVPIKHGEIKKYLKDLFNRTKKMKKNYKKMHPQEDLEVEAEEPFHHLEEENTEAEGNISEEEEIILEEG